MFLSYNRLSNCREDSSFPSVELPGGMLYARMLMHQCMYNFKCMYTHTIYLCLRVMDRLVQTTHVTIQPVTVATSNATRTPTRAPSAETVFCKHCSAAPELLELSTLREDVSSLKVDIGSLGVWSQVEQSHELDVAGGHSVQFVVGQVATSQVGQVGGGSVVEQ